MKSCINVAVVGAGYGLRTLVPACVAHPSINVVSLVTASAVRPVELDPSIGHVNDLRSIAATECVDAVIIASPHHLHHEHVKFALRSGKHVLCQKPLSLTLPNANELLTLCKAKSLIGMMDFNFRFIPERALLFEVIASGMIGNVRTIKCEFCRDDYNKWPSPWYYETAKGGGALISTGSHLVDSVTVAAGSPICSVVGTIFKKEQVDVGFRCEVVTYSGIQATIHVNHSKQGVGKHVMVVEGNDGSLEVNGSGVVKLTTKKGLIKNLCPSERHFWDTDFTSADDNHRLQPTSFVVSEFVRLISGKSSSSKLDFLTGVENLRVLSAIRRSSETGEVITIKA
ncbi:Gfo/Idh/MocA family oxidoreductase [Candidatus Kaiserbacteria bacterium]|nr:Gfo/Idh/MocA family oxidoreductase [Candidatus Kaiserbacteria bacterium]